MTTNSKSTQRAIEEGRALVNEIVKTAPVVDDPFDDPGDAGTTDGGPGPWFIAGYDDECSRGGEPIGEGDTIRADGAGGWECRDCVESDRIDADEDPGLYDRSRDYAGVPDPKQAA